MIEYVGIVIRTTDGRELKRKIRASELVEGAWLGGRKALVVSDQFDDELLNSISVRTNLPARKGL